MRIVSGFARRRRRASRLTVICAGLAAIVATGPASAQQRGESRAPLRGRVLDREDRPWTGAVVELVGSPSPTHWGIPGTDAITTTADEDGHFIVQARDPSGRTRSGKPCLP